MLELVPNYRPAVTHVHGDTNYADYLFSAYPQPRLSGYLDISTPPVVVSAGVCPVSRVTCPGGCITSLFPPPCLRMGTVSLIRGQDRWQEMVPPHLCPAALAALLMTLHSINIYLSRVLQCSALQGRAGQVLQLDEAWHHCQLSLSPHFLQQCPLLTPPPQLVIKTFIVHMCL